MREAITEFKVLKRNADKTSTFIEAKPKTGRTHQIRVHFKYIHHPLISDALYAPNMLSLFDFHRTALHSYSIKFKAQDGGEVSCIADYPDDFSRALTYFK
jgi:23S rRNA pseudouridine1911/1915/1917 synthase